MFWLKTKILKYCYRFQTNDDDLQQEMIELKKLTNVWQQMWLFDFDEYH